MHKMKDLPEVISDVKNKVQFMFGMSEILNVEFYHGTTVIIITKEVLLFNSKMSSYASLNQNGQNVTFLQSSLVE